VKKRLIPLGAAALFLGALGVTLPTVTTTAAAATGGTRLIPSGGTTSIRAAGVGPDRLQQPELRPSEPGDEDGAAAPVKAQPSGGGPFPKHPLPAPRVRSSAVTRSNPGAQLSVDGLTQRDQRLANNGNQFSVEPPDQALCVGNSFVVEAVNDAIQVRSSRSGHALTGVQDLNTFFKKPATINRTTNVFGPFTTDPVCLYDRTVNRFVVAITTLGTVPATGAFNGKNTIDVAVSNTGDPRKAWTVYSIPAQNDGTQGTPNHGCTLDGKKPGPCFQDYPHIGADANGVYISTNEYDLFGPNYNAAQVFAFSKAQLAAHPSKVRVTLVPNLHVAGTPGFTVWPAQSLPGQFSRAARGTEFFLSTIAGDGSETGNPTGTANKIGVWGLTNTASLRTASPDLRISSRLTKSEAYVFPPNADQKKGPTPLAACINDTKLPTPFGPGCWQEFFTPDQQPKHNQKEARVDTNDTRMQQTWYVNGMLWGTADTAVRVGGKVKAGIAWFAVRPKVSHDGGVRGEVHKQGYLALRDNNLSYPAIALTPKGQGAIAFSVMGKDFYPSAGYVRIRQSGQVGAIHIASRGRGPEDGFTGYESFNPGTDSSRWGDYGAAVVDNGSIWVASEYIGQRCTLGQYYPNPPDQTNFGSCNNTRTALANWYTRITKLR
jgi:hypothetical protein